MGHPPRNGGLDPAVVDELVETDSFGILTTELRRLEAEGHDIDDLLSRVIRAGNLEDVEDLGSLLRFRIQKVTATYPASSRQAPGLIIGLVPRATGITDPAMRQALEEREQLMQARLNILTQAVLEHAEPWVTALDIADPAVRQSTVRAVVAYRDRWGITSTSPLGQSRRMMRNVSTTNAPAPVSVSQGPPDIWRSDHPRLRVVEPSDEPRSCLDKLNV